MKDLLGEAGVTGDTVEDGIEYPFYVTDAAHTLYQHIARLASRSGYFSHMTAEGKLSFVPFAADAVVQTFHYGEDLIAAQIGDAPAPAGVLFTGKGAAGSRARTRGPGSSRMRRPSKRPRAMRVRRSLSSMPPCARAGHWKRQPPRT